MAVDDSSKLRGCASSCLGAKGWRLRDHDVRSSGWSLIHSTDREGARVPGPRRRRCDRSACRTSLRRLLQSPRQDEVGDRVDDPGC